MRWFRRLLCVASGERTRTGAPRAVRGAASVAARRRWPRRTRSRVLQRLLNLLLYQSPLLLGRLIVRFEIPCGVGTEGAHVCVPHSAKGRRAAREAHVQPPRDLTTDSRPRPPRRVGACTARAGQAPCPPWSGSPSPPHPRKIAGRARVQGTQDSLHVRQERPRQRREGRPIPGGAQPRASTVCLAHGAGGPATRLADEVASNVHGGTSAHTRRGRPSREDPPAVVPSFSFLLWTFLACVFFLRSETILRTPALDPWPSGLRAQTLSSSADRSSLGRWQLELCVKANYRSREPRGRRSASLRPHWRCQCHQRPAQRREAQGPPRPRPALTLSPRSWARALFALGGPRSRRGAL